jgi:hypothetical protein
MRRAAYLLEGPPRGAASQIAAFAALTFDSPGTIIRSHAEQML